jgi:hypothetical protein
MLSWQPDTWDLGTTALPKAYGQHNISTPSSVFPQVLASRQLTLQPAANTESKISSK